MQNDLFFFVNNIIGVFMGLILPYIHKWGRENA
jgi:hypothetical protein